MTRYGLSSPSQRGSAPGRSRVNGSSRLMPGDFRLRPRSRMKGDEIIDASVAPFCHSQNHPGSVAVAVRGVTASRALESPHLQRQPLVSRKAFATGHRRVRGPDQHHLPAGPATILNQRPFSSRNGGVRRLARHGGLGKFAERWLAARFLLVDSFIPQPAAAVPFSFKRCLGLFTGAHPVGVVHRLDDPIVRRNNHGATLSRATDNPAERRKRRFLPTATTRGIHAVNSQ
jgi:hypothetical protein